MTPAGRIRHPTYSVPGSDGATRRCRHLPGRTTDRLSPASGARQGLTRQDTRTMPLDVQRAYVPCNTRFFHD